MVLSSGQVAILFLVMGCAAAILSMLQIHSRLRNAQIRAQLAESKAMLLEVENLQLRNRRKYANHGQGPTNAKPEPEGATFELCKKTGSWRVT